MPTTSSRSASAHAAKAARSSWWRTCWYRSVTIAPRRFQRRRPITCTSRARNAFAVRTTDPMFMSCASSRSRRGSRAGAGRGRRRRPRAASSGTGRRRCAGRRARSSSGSSRGSSGHSPCHGPTPTSARAYGSSPAGSTIGQPMVTRWASPSPSWSSCRTSAPTSTRSPPARCTPWCSASSSSSPGCWSASSCPATRSSSAPGWSRPSPDSGVDLTVLAAGAFAAAVAGDSRRLRDRLAARPRLAAAPGRGRPLRRTAPAPGRGVLRALRLVGGRGRALDPVGADVHADPGRHQPDGLRTVPVGERRRRAVLGGRADRCWGTSPPREPWLRRASYAVAGAFIAAPSSWVSWAGSAAGGRRAR